jgi:predicted amidohydrolase
MEAGSAHASSAAALSGETVRELRDLASTLSAYIVAGLYLREGGAPSNGAIMVSPSGEILAGRDAEGGLHAVYRKVQLCNIPTVDGRFYEDEYFEAGSHHLVWDTDLGRVGCLICYDRHFPEAWRALRRSGADIVAVPVASSARSRPWFVAEMQAMSLQQGVYAVTANRAGTERLQGGVTTTYAGLSCITAPDGSALAVADFDVPNQVVSATTDPDLLTRVRIEHRFFDDVRWDVYERETREQSDSAS